ncbi:DUF6438 domain-containing protein [Vicingaceae bacterium]|nr:DUF6438 domain-containing protein [Vicingaceae bacterium]MDB4062182.1 DUF6438 domain-containing protein [Vicingaceae bacterium]MDC1451559.1 DUF6438 domain-containing protein [Vicingaceae bacterium]
MKTTIYLFTILLVLNACKGKKEVAAQEGKPKIETAAKEITDAEREAEIVEQMKNEKLPNEGEDYYEMVEKEIPADAVARIQRTACFGRCPIYTLTVYEDGRAEYFGKNFAPREGMWIADVTPELMEQLLIFANEIEYFELENIYDKEAVTDVPSTISSLRTVQGLKTVVNRFDAPEELRRFEQYFDELFKDVEWLSNQRD